MLAETPQEVAAKEAAKEAKYSAAFEEALAAAPAAPFPPGGRELTREESRRFLIVRKAWPFTAPKRGKRGPASDARKMLFRGAYHKLVRLPEVRVKKQAGERLRAIIRTEVNRLKQDKVPRHRWRARIAGIRNIGVNSDRIGRVLKEMYPRK